MGQRRYTYIHYREKLKNQKFFALLDELGFELLEPSYVIPKFYHAEEDWLLFLVDTAHDKQDDLAGKLRERGFPVDRILRLKRLQALRTDPPPTPAG